MTEALNNLEDYLTLMHYNIKPYASSDRSSLCHHLLKDRKYFYQIELKQQAGAFWNIELLIHFWLKQQMWKKLFSNKFLKFIHTCLKSNMWYSGIAPNWKVNEYEFKSMKKKTVTNHKKFSPPLHQHQKQAVLRGIE